MKRKYPPANLPGRKSCASLRDAGELGLDCSPVGGFRPVGIWLACMFDQGLRVSLLGVESRSVVKAKSVKMRKKERKIYTPVAPSLAP